jgi:hypothetical protein
MEHTMGRVIATLLTVLWPALVAGQSLIGQQPKDTYRGLIWDGAGNGAPTDGTVQLHDGAGAAFGLHLADYLLTGATDEVGIRLSYDVAKSSGNATLLAIEATDTASPGNLALLTGTVGDARWGFFEGDLRLNNYMDIRMVSVFGNPAANSHYWRLSPTRFDVISTFSVLWGSGSATVSPDLDIGRYDDGVSAHLCVSDGDETGCDGGLMVGTLDVGGATFTRAGTWLTITAPVSAADIRVTASMQVPRGFRQSTPYTPATRTEYCLVGTRGYDDEYLYQCLSDSTWGRVSWDTAW